MNFVVEKKSVRWGGSWGQPPAVKKPPSPKMLSPHRSYDMEVIRGVPQLGTGWGLAPCQMLG